MRRTIYVGDYNDVMQAKAQQDASDDGLLEIAQAVLTESIATGVINDRDARLFRDRMNRVPYKAIALRYKIKEPAARQEFHRIREKLVGLISDELESKGHGMIAEGKMLWLLLRVFGARQLSLAGRL